MTLNRRSFLSMTAIATTLAAAAACGSSDSSDSSGTVAADTTADTTYTACHRACSANERAEHPSIVGLRLLYGTRWMPQDPFCTCQRVWILVADRNSAS